MSTTLSIPKSILPGIACAFFCITAAAQKLPDSQEAAFRAPAGVKIDGKAGEWTAMRAFNKSTQVSYSVANDDSTLYLVVQSNIPGITSKILSGGITLTINNEGKKKEKGGVSVLFPAPVVRSAPASGANRATVAGGSIVVSASGMPTGARGGSADDKRRRDSMTFVNNNNRIKKFTEVKVLGVAGLDTMLSIYNEEGIKARASYDEQGVYTYELAMPFKYLGIDINQPREFFYNVKLNGLPMFGGGGGIQLSGVSSITVNGAGGGGGSSDFMAMMSPTDFWGKYTPVK